MDHARVSELLPAYDRRELTSDEVGAVRSHLQGCPDCERELAGLRALRATAVEPLTAEERSSLHRQISQTLQDDRTEVVVPRPAGRRWLRFVPAFAGIATLALIVASATFLGGSGDMEAGGGDGGASVAPEAAGDVEGGGGSGGTTSGALYAGDIGTVTSRSLRRDTRRGTLEGLSARLVRRAALTTGASTEDAETEPSPEPRTRRDERRVEENVDALQVQADAATGRQIRECVASVEDNFPFAAIPVWAATATLEGDRVLLVAFSRRAEDSGRRRELMLWAWPIGDCRIPVFYGSTTPPK